MYLAQGAPQIHSRKDVLRPNETIQSVACNAGSDIVVSVSQLQVHFWSSSSATGAVVYLNSVHVPGASLDADPAMHALWHPQRHNILAVVTSRRVLFMEADIHLRRDSFLGLGNAELLDGPGSEKCRSVPFCDVKSRVCFTDEVAIDNGMTSSVAPAGPHGFLVNTTAGVVNVLGWVSRTVHHSFTVISLRAAHHKLSVAPQRSRDAQASPSAVPGTDTDDSFHEQQQQQHIHHRILTGAILHGTFCPKLQLFAMVMSSGFILLAKPSCGLDFARGELSLVGTFVAMPAACSCALNGNRRLLAVASHSGSLSCYRLEAVDSSLDRPLAVTAGSPVWRRNGTHKGDSSASRNHGPISALEWSPGKEDVICVGFYRVGVMALHYSGACIMSSFTTEVSLGSPIASQAAAAAGVVDASASAQIARSSLRGCLSLQWCQGLRRVLVVEPQSSQLVSFAFSRVISADQVGPDVGLHTPLCLLDSDGISVVDHSSAVGTDGQSCFVPAPRWAGSEALPLRFAGISGSGDNIAVAGRRGLLTHCRNTGLWSGFPNADAESKCVCLCDPVWLGDSLVAVATVTDRTKFQVIVFLSWDICWDAVVAKHSLDARPTCLSVLNRDARGDGFLVVLDITDRLHVLRFNMFRDGFAHKRPVAESERVRVAFTPLRTIELDAPGTLQRPVGVWPVCAMGGGIRDNRAAVTVDDVPQLVIQSQQGHGLLLLNPVGDDAFTARAKQFQVIKISSRTGYTLTELTRPASLSVDLFNVWVDRFSPLNGINLAVHEEEGLVYYNIVAKAAGGARAGAVTAEGQPHPSAGGSGPFCDVHRMRVISSEADIIPLCLSPFDGYALGVAEGYAATSCSPVASALNCRSFGQLFLRPILYAPRVLALLLQKSMPPVPGAVHRADPGRTVTGLLLPPALTGNGAVVIGPGSAVAVAVRAPHRPHPPRARDGAGSRLAASFAWEEPLFCWLQTMRENGSFVPSLDQLLLSILDESPPGGVANLDRRSAVRAVVSLLRNYPEFYEVMVGCVRKIDMSRWHVVLDFLGSPLDLYQECIDNRRYTEAVHLVRVIMMTSYGTEEPPSRVGSVTAASAPATPNGTEAAVPGPGKVPSRCETLQQACTCAVTLLGHAICNGEFAAGYDLLRFTALVRHEIGMPVAVEVSEGDGTGGGGGGGESMFGRWIRTFIGGGSAHPKHAPRLGGDLATAIEGCPSLHFFQGKDGEAATVITNDDAEAQQRLEATRMMFGTDPELPRMVEAEAGRLFENGRLLRLCRLLETFSLSLDGFVLTQCYLRSGVATASGDEAVPASAFARPIWLASVFDGLHTELGLPRSVRPIGRQGSRALCQDTSAIQDHMAIWTQAQVALYGDRRNLSALQTIQTLFGGNNALIDLALAMLRTAKADVMAILTGSTAAEDDAKWPPERIARCAGLLAELSALTSLPPNHGYAAFLDTVVASLPPSMLRARDHERRPGTPLSEKSAESAPAEATVDDSGAASVAGVSAVITDDVAPPADAAGEDVPPPLSE